ncbi:hypothetical protein FB451DRAFT_1391156 [Mycena latifolia]|nr:hypothetical protein FB451DRAFT_1391156 [Mycena latifolia]
MVRGQKSRLPANQLAFLEEHMREFKTLQAGKSLGTFWSKVTWLWFQRWPVEPSLGLPILNTGGVIIEESNVPPEHQLAIIHNWFNNQSSKKKRLTNGSSASSSASSSSGSSSLVDLIQNYRRSRTWKWQLVEVWQKEHGPEMEAALKAAGFNDLMSKAPATETPAERKAQMKAKLGAQMQLRHQIAKDQIAQAAPEEQVRVEALYLKQGSLGGGAAPAMGTPAGYQVGIEKMGPMLHEIHTMLRETTGWIGATVMTGPVPKLSGKIATQLYCFGVTPAGNTLEQAHVQWDEAVMKPVAQFRKQCFGG